MNKKNKRQVRRYFFDTEFHDQPDKFSCELISIGIVNENGGEYYGISNEFNLAAAAERPWLKKNVLSKLGDSSKWVELEEIKKHILDMIKPARTVEFWARNGSHDNVLLCQLFGGMGNLRETLKKEKGIENVVFRDIHELDREAPDIKINKQHPQHAHIAINDARYEHYCYTVLSQAVAFKRKHDKPPSPGGMD